KTRCRDKCGHCMSRAEATDRRQPQLRKARAALRPWLAAGCADHQAQPRVATAAPQLVVALGQPVVDLVHARGIEQRERRVALVRGCVEVPETGGASGGCGDPRARAPGVSVKL